jgi:hypothetical protein
VAAPASRHVATAAHAAGERLAESIAITPLVLFSSNGWTLARQSAPSP